MLTSSIPKNYGIFISLLEFSRNNTVIQLLQDFDKNIVFLTDSQAAITALKSFKTTSKVVLYCRSLLIKMAEHNVVKVLSMGGKPCRYRRKRKRDELAREGADSLLVEDLKVDVMEEF